MIEKVLIEAGVEYERVPRPTFLASLQGKVGKTGPQGSQGAKGDTGLKGDTGSRGDKGDKGDKGPQGVICADANK
ncbi:MAG: hypothetical protein ACXVRQ_03035 [Gaiellaceae bacterium]